MESVVRPATVADGLLSYHVLIRVTSDTVEEMLSDILFLQMYFGIDETPKMNIVRRLLNQSRTTRIFNNYSVEYLNEPYFAVNKTNAKRIVKEYQSLIRENVNAIQEYRDEMDRIVEQAN